jgi:hypothetical protein
MSVLVEEIVARIDQLSHEELEELDQVFAQRAKPGVESLRLMRVLERTRWQSFVSRLGKITRKTLLWGILLGIIVASGVLSAYFLRTNTIAAGSRKDQFEAGIGFTVEQHSYRNRSRLIFDDGGDGQVICDLSPMKIDRLVEQRWLANGRALYLHLLLKSPEALGADGQPEARLAKVIYDYHRGELYLTSPLHLWRTGSSESHWMNEEEFAGVLARFNQ